MSDFKKIFGLMIVCGALVGCGGAASTDEVTDARSQTPDQIADDETGVVENETGQGTDQQPGNNQDQSEDQVADDESTTGSPNDSGDNEAPPFTQDTLTASVSWEPAGFYEDGSVMTADEISHYEILYGTDANNLNNLNEVTLTGILSYDFSSLTEKTWYVAVKTVSIYGTTSDASNVVALQMM